MPGYYVVVTDEKISAVTPFAPTEAQPVIETEGVIFPGLIDGHGHVEYNHIPLADLGKRYRTAISGRTRRSTRRWSRIPRTP